jgi:acyl-CoA thioester hydrolase
MERAAMIEVLRSSPNTWECDEMGHMNVRFYVSKMMEGLASFACEAGMPSAFRPRARSTLVPRDQHIRFIREARAGQPITMHAGVLEVTDSSMLLYQQIDHASGEPCATFRTWIDHVDVDAGIAFPWSRSVRSRLAALRADAPAALGPRSIDMTVAPRTTASMADADAIGAPEIGRGAVPHTHCDLHGHMLPEFFIGRVSDSISNLLGPWREDVEKIAAARGETLRTGGAVLEYRLAYRRWPRAGDRFVVRSARGPASEKTHSFFHWVLDPDSGAAWCTSQAVAVTFNLDTRKIIPAPPGHLEALAKLAPEGLSV